MQRFLILFLFFYILSLIQTGFLIHFNIKGGLPNLLLISVFLSIFLENPRKNFSFFGALVGGFFLDIFSNSFLGISIITLLLMTFLLKRVMLILRELNIFWFLILLFVSMNFYNLFSPFINSLILFKITSFQIDFTEVFVVEVIYNLILGLIIFYLLRFFKKYVFIRPKKGA